MNTWIVASHPIGHWVEISDKQAEQDSGKETSTLEAETEATYYLKARIFAGQANLKGNSYGFDEFKWLSKEEIQKTVTHEYWSSIKNMLVDQ